MGSPWWSAVEGSTEMKCAYPPNAAALAQWEQKPEATLLTGEICIDESQPRGPAHSPEPPTYPRLRDLTQPAVPTAQAAYYLNRRPQTLRGWACAETWPEGLRPVRINGRLAWPVAGIKAVLGVCNEL